MVTFLPWVCLFIKRYHFLYGVFLAVYPAGGAHMAAAGGDGGAITEETRRAEREHFESIIRAFLWYRDHGMESIKKAEVPLCAAPHALAEDSFRSERERRWNWWREEQMRGEWQAGVFAHIMVVVTGCSAEGVGSSALVRVCVRALG
jgi:hypothetical protein